MVFNNFKIHKGYIRGKGQDTVGAFEIVGQIEPGTKNVHFLKQYIGQHSVEYHGTYNKSKGEIAGRWSMPAYGASDDFKIKVRTKISCIISKIESIRRELRRQQQRLGLTTF